MRIAPPVEEKNQLSNSYLNAPAPNNFPGPRILIFQLVFLTAQDPLDGFPFAAALQKSDQMLSLIKENSKMQENSFST